MTDVVISSAMLLIEAERQRQIDEEGWTPDHDDQHEDGELMRAAMCYYLHAIITASYRDVVVGQQQDRRIRTRRAYETVTVPVPISWPWERRWWKPRNKKRDLVRSGALMLAEKDRLSRLGRDSSHINHKLGLVEAALSEEIAK
ncbi:hypothetical protein [Filomicrobium sp.]|uniref:hypothetical protein n=1 Tax=Filomicrobium sp. TaxID=2024831 RepID=UPI002589C774|nr:hypothetical protein [Filomicrobium sp.]MCV0371110.1 hypothetical protein [Filomicrobium sp.]